MFKLSRFVVVALLCVLVPRVGHTISESEFEKTFANQVIPFYETQGESGTFLGVRDIAIYYRYFKAPSEKGAVIFVTGAGEFTLKHAETIYDLFQSGYSVYSLDHRNQGYSGKLTADPGIIHVENFDDYIEDLDHYIREIVRPETHRKLYLVGHSMGGAISSLYMERFPSVFSAAALSAPMLDINTSPYSKLVASWIVNAACFFGKGADYAPGQEPAKKSRAFTFSSNDGGVRSIHYQKVREEHPELAMEGVSNRWVKEGLDVDRKILEHASEARTPVLLIQAGKDSSVLPGGQDEFCSKAANCTKLLLPDSLHDILMQPDVIRDVAMQGILKHFESY